MMGGPPHASGEKSVKETSLHGERIRTIYVLRNGQALPLEVTTGLTDGSQTEIVSGELAEGDEVIVDQRRAGK
jgi:HlyD family secretion protein